MLILLHGHKNTWKFLFCFINGYCYLLLEILFLTLALNLYNYVLLAMILCMIIRTK